MITWKDLNSTVTEKFVGYFFNEEVKSVVKECECDPVCVSTKKIYVRLQTFQYHPLLS